MEPHQECAYDHIVVYDGHTTESRHRELDQMELKVRDFQKKIDIIYRLKQICCFTILNSLFEFSRVFCY